MNTLAEEYVKSLTPIEKQAYDIAKDHLGTLFNIEKTNGYLQWVKGRDQSAHKSS